MSIWKNLSMRTKIIGLVALMVLLVLVNLLAVFIINSLQADDALVVNLAGRQRMLSQRMGKNSFLLMTQELLEPLERVKSTEELSTAKDLFDTTLLAFINGGQTIDGDGNLVSIHNIGNNLPFALEVQELWKEFKKQINILLLSPDIKASRFIFDNNNRLLALSNNVVTAIQKTAEQKVKWLQQIQISIFIISLILFSLLIIIINRLITKPIINEVHVLLSESQHVSKAAEKLKANSTRMASMSVEQASSLEETSTTLNQISSMVQQTTRSTNYAKELAKKMIQLVQNGDESADHVVNSMNQITGISRDINSILSELESIAFQTNILSLNASVEAARAGEAGAGFSVVAEEVRNLSNKSADFVKKTSETISTSSDLTNKGFALVTNMKNKLKEIVDSVGEVNKIITDIDNASRQHSQGVEQINKAVEQMEEVTHTIASNAETTSHSADDFHQQAGNLRKIVRSLDSIVRGG